MSRSAVMTNPKNRTKTAQRPRLQLDFTEEAFQRLEAMKELAGVRTNAELIRNALRVYDWLLTESNRSDDVRIQITNGDKIREVELFLKWPRP